MYVKKGKTKGTYYLTITDGTDITGKKIRYNRTVHVSGTRELQREKINLFETFRTVSVRHESEVTLRYIQCENTFTTTICR